MITLTPSRDSATVCVMARKLRMEYAGAIYHGPNRGDRCEAILRDDEDPRCVLDTLGEASGKTGWHVRARSLLPDSCHPVETSQSNLVTGMSRRWSLEGLERLAKSDTEKLRLSQRSRGEATVRGRWTAERWRKGAAGYRNHLLHRRRKRA